MKDFLRFLREDKVWWITPIVIFVALLIYLAWKEAGIADNPFTYDL